MCGDGTAREVHEEVRDKIYMISEYISKTIVQPSQNTISSSHAMMWQPTTRNQVRKTGPCFWLRFFNCGNSKPLSAKS